MEKVQLPIRFTHSGYAQALPVHLHEACSARIHRRNLAVPPSSQAEWNGGEAPVRKMRGGHVQAHPFHPSSCHDDEEDDGPRREVGKWELGTKTSGL